MVKGTAKQAVIVLPGADPRFEQAIFILSPGTSHTQLSSPGEMLSLADSLAAQYCTGTVPRYRLRALMRTPWISFLFGCALTGLAWYLSSLLL
jgi:hypothetical protein